MSAAPSVPPARAAPRLATWIRLVGAALLVVLLVAGAAVGVQLHRAVPQPRLDVAVPSVPTPAVAAVPLPWPREGQAALSIEGVAASAAPGTERPIPIGSVAKVMTAYLVLQQHPLKHGERGPLIRVNRQQAADYAGRDTSGESLLPVTDGEALTERQALDALLVPSANNVADLLAAWTAGSVPRFVQQMNDTARRLHLPGTHYADASGYRSATTGTATDQVRLAEQALQDPMFAEIVAQRQVELPLLGVVPNYNSLLGADGVIGVKTGSTRPAGGNIVFAARQRVGGRTVTLVGAVLGQQVGDAALTALSASLATARRLLVAVERSLQPVRLIERSVRVGTLRTAWGPSSAVVTGGSVELVAAPGTAPVLTLQSAGRVPTDASRPAGILDVGLGEQHAQVPLQLSTPVPKAPLSWRLTRGW